MYSRFQLIKKYFHYRFTAFNGKGHGMHSPFVFEFITNVLNDKNQHDCFSEIESLRKRLRNDERLLIIEDFGAGSRVNPQHKRKVSAIAKSALKPKKYAQLLFKIARHFLPDQNKNTILELGTSLGITTAYLANANKNGEVVSMEGSSEVAYVANENFQSLHLPNIRLIKGNFDTTLKEYITALENKKSIDLAFIDGNHRKEPTIQYFKDLLPVLNENSVLIFDDIHWSREMEQAWDIIKADPSVTLTIDLFFIGLVFFRKEQKVKQHFSIRY